LQFAQLVRHRSSASMELANGCRQLRRWWVVPWMLMTSHTSPPHVHRPQGLPDGGEPFGESGTLSGREVLPARGQIWKKDEKGCCPPHWRNIPALSRIVGKTWSSCGQSQLQRAPACAQERPQGSLPLAKPCFSGCVQHWK
ncbi:unnamed protein product, partial [Durusdinium trenchii]